MINATLVNNFFEGVTLKSFYRYYGLSNHSSQVSLPQGFVNLDSGPAPAAREWKTLYPIQRIASALRGAIISSVGCRPSSAMVTTECTGMIARSSTQDKYGFGPTFDIKPISELLFRAAYKHLWGNDFCLCNALPEAAALTNIARKFDEAASRRNKTSLFAQYTPLDNLDDRIGALSL